MTRRKEASAKRTTEGIASELIAKCHDIDDEEFVWAYPREIEPLRVHVRRSLVTIAELKALCQAARKEKG